MNAKNIFNDILNAAQRFLDTDKDGKLEVSDLPGALSQIAGVKAQGEALLAAADKAFDGLKGLVGLGKVTTQGRTVSPEELDAKWTSAEDKFKLGAAEARTLLDGPDDDGE